MSKEVQAIMHQAMEDMDNVIAHGVAVAGKEFRCNVDFMSDKARQQVRRFIGVSILARLKAVLRGEKYVEPFPLPWVCHRSPDHVELVRQGEKIVPKTGYTLITFIGYNFYQENLPQEQNYACALTGMHIWGGRMLTDDEYHNLLYAYTVGSGYDWVVWGILPHPSRYPPTWAMAALSPELFFTLDGETLTGRPMDWCGD